MGEIAADGVTWVVKCKNCGREARLSAEQLGTMFEPETTYEKARARLKCKRCFVRGENYLSATARPLQKSSEDWGNPYGGIYDRRTG